MLDRKTQVLRWLMLALVLGLTLSGGSAPVSAQSPTPDAKETDQLTAVLPDARDDIADVLDRGLTAYTIDVTMTEGDGGGALSGIVDIAYVNDTGASIESVPLRMYANGQDDPITITTANVNGSRVEPELSVYRSVATLPLGDELVAGESIALSIGFDAVVPVGNVVHYGIYGIDGEQDTWALAHWYPVVAGWVEGEGWELDPPSQNGDPVFSTTSTYDVTIHAPESLHLVTSGVETAHQVDGEVQSSRFVTGPARDFAIVADDAFQLTSTEIDGTIVNSWYLPGEETNGAKVAEYAARALGYYNDEIGQYPFVELDVLSVEVYGALGVEFPQLIYIARDYYTREIDLEEPGNLEFTVAHEVLHQWWYGMVGNNQYEHAFIDEGLTNYISGDLYFREVYGEEAGEAFSFQAFRTPYADGLDTRGDQVVDMPTDDYPSGSDYVFAMYFKGASGFAAIQDEIGREAFFDGLTLYFDRFRFGIAEPADLQTAFEDASGQDLEDLWDLWFEETAAA